MNNDKKLLNDFLADEDVQGFLAQQNDGNIFTLLEIDEYRNNRYLEWLLNPRESHKIGSYYLKALLYAALDQLQTDSYYKQLNKEWNPIEFEWALFDNSIIFNELMLDTKSRIDLAIIDHENEMGIFIETKVYSNCDQAQLKRYQKIIEKKYSSIKHKLFIFLHPQEEEASLAPSPWLSLTYAWLTSSIEKRLYCEMLENNTIRDILQFYVDWMNDEFPFSNNVFYMDIAQHLRKNHEEFINHFKIKVTNVQDNVQGVIDGDDMQLLYLRHQQKFDYLFDFSKWDYLARQIVSKLPYSIDYEFGNHYLSFHNDAWYDCYERGDSDKIFHLRIVILEQTTEAKKQKEHHYSIALRWDKEYIKAEVRRKIELAFKDTMRTKQLVKYPVPLNISSTANNFDAALLKKLTPEIEKLLEQVNAALS